MSLTHQRGAVITGRWIFIAEPARSHFHQRLDYLHTTRVRATTDAANAAAGKAEPATTGVANARAANAFAGDADGAPKIDAAIAVGQKVDGQKTAAKKERAMLKRAERYAPRHRRWFTKLGDYLSMNKGEQIAGWELVHAIERERIETLSAKDVLARLYLAKAKLEMSKTAIGKSLSEKIAIFLSPGKTS